MKYIKGYEGIYSITSCGKVYSHISKRFLSASNNGEGYLFVRLSKGEARKAYIHRLVAEAYIPNPNNYPVINHKDENPSNNNIKNIEWCTVRYNNNYGTCKERAAVSKGKKTYCVEQNRVFKSTAEASRETGVNRAHIWACCNGFRKKAGGFHWQHI
jgi:hypothetical protein